MNARSIPYIMILKKVNNFDIIIILKYHILKMGGLNGKSFD